ncbi:hypothetical protein K470DRAFT_262109 [Piedraia hortae CBS 480.64]|uniref:Uncharacterized protein n=1 Tax=Piedraia hortae CBS 480.64 TaxID=1314780 RepID=A0A6A7C9N2_9PEZI|nr:hypothetical protein K470DRAFT_262109 [Piedraia hortae CBS 480.64]
MDVVREAIPKGYLEGIRKRPPENVPKSSSANFNMVSEETIEVYTRDRLRLRLQYLDSVENDKLSPPLFHTRIPIEIDLYMRLVTLRQPKYLANYGRYLGRTPEAIRSKLRATEENAPDPETAPTMLDRKSRKAWTKLYKELEGTDWKETKKHHSLAAHCLGYNERALGRLIDEWTENNQTLHDNVSLYINQGDWLALSCLLARDIRELLLVSLKDETASEHERVLLLICDEYLDLLPNEHAKKLAEAKGIKESDEE